MDRIEVDTLPIEEENQILGNFHASGVCPYQLPDGRTGYYKHSENISRKIPDEYDLREYLASQILSTLGEDCAEIMLASRGQEKGCISVNILHENETFAKMPSAIEIYSMEDYINFDLQSVKELPGITAKDVAERKDYLIKRLFLAAVLSDPDFRTDNMLMIHNEKTGEYRNPPYYDMGLAFMNTSYDPKTDPLERPDKLFFGWMSAEQVIDTLYEKYPEQVVPLGNLVQSKLTPGVVNEIMLKDGLKEEMNPSTWGDIKSDWIDRWEHLKELNQQKKYLKFHIPYSQGRNQQEFNKNQIEGAIVKVNPEEQKWKEMLRRAVNFIKEKTREIKNNFKER